MRRAVVLAALGAALVLVPSSVGAGSPEVSIEFSDYRPSQIDVLPGETVSWTNVSLRTHTVTSDTDLFDSGDIVSNAHFSLKFDEVGAYAYHCTIHPSIRGEIDVRRVTLDPLPPAVVPVGKDVEFSGRTATPSQPVLIQRLVGGGATSVATATPKTDGSWSVNVKADKPGDFRAAVGTDVSETRRLLVSVWKVGLEVHGGKIDATVTPAAPYSRFLVEVYLRERFGWWPIANGKFDYVSSAEVNVKRPARVRIVLVDKDGWTPLATSRVVKLR